MHFSSDCKIAMEGSTLNFDAMLFGASRTSAPGASDTSSVPPVATYDLNRLRQTFFRKKSA
jgi:hypothetical protein